MKRKPIVLPADPADPEDFDVTDEAMDRGLRARLIRRTRTHLGQAVRGWQPVVPPEESDTALDCR